MVSCGRGVFRAQVRRVWARFGPGSAPFSLWGAGGLSNLGTGTAVAGRTSQAPKSIERYSDIFWWGSGFGGSGVSFNIFLWLNPFKTVFVYIYIHICIYVVYLSSLSKSKGWNNMLRVPSLWWKAFLD